MDLPNVLMVLPLRMTWQDRLMVSLHGDDTTDRHWNDWSRMVRNYATLRQPMASRLSILLGVPMISHAQWIMPNVRAVMGDELAPEPDLQHIADAICHWNPAVVVLWGTRLGRWSFNADLMPLLQDRHTIRARHPQLPGRDGWQAVQIVSMSIRAALKAYE